MAVATVKLHTISGNQSDAHERTRPPAGSFPLCAVGVPWRLLDSRFGRFASGLPYVGKDIGLPVEPAPLLAGGREHLAPTAYKNPSAPSPRLDPAQSTGHATLRPGLVRPVRPGKLDADAQRTPLPPAPIS